MSRKKVEINPIRGERLKMLLIENGIDQKELADKINYSKEHISYIINGRRNLTEDAAQAIIKLFPGTRIEWLMGYDDFKTPLHAKVFPAFQTFISHRNRKRALKNLLSVYGLSFEFDPQSLSPDVLEAFNNTKTEDMDKIPEDILMQGIDEFWELDDTQPNYILKHSSGEIILRCSENQIKQLEIDIEDYLEFKLNKLENQCKKGEGNG